VTHASPRSVRPALPIAVEVPVIPAPRPHDPGSRLLTERVDRSSGRIRASGYLTSQGADLLSGTADSLRGNGHMRVVIDLQDVRSADDAGLDILQTLRTEFAASGGELLLEHPPQAG
jgi:ABC-type transporter Mla MlaB component